MENFIVSARKYRPSTFASVVGQRHITSTLKNAIERGQLAHAYMFCGPRGVGKTTCARIFAKAINCLNPQGGEACNECESCRSFNEGRSLNVHELDAASNNSVDDIRNLIEQVRIIPQQGRYSVFVIDEVHMLSAAAFNAFLKTLEEPPKHAIFILATTEKHKIIPTILSRCQIYDFNRIKVEDGVEYLRYIADKEGVTADDEALNLIAHKADGGMRDALSMFDKAVSFCGDKLNYKDVAATLNVLDYDTYFNITEQLLAGRYIDALMAFNDVVSRGFSPQTFISGLNAHMRDLLLAKGPAIALVEFTGTLIERYRQQATRCDEGFLFNAIALLTEADGKIRLSSNQRLLVELGLMKIAGLGQKKNDEVATDSFATNFPLPELQPAPQTGQSSVTEGRTEGRTADKPEGRTADKPEGRIADKPEVKQEAKPEVVVAEAKVERAVAEGTPSSEGKVGVQSQPEAAQRTESRAATARRATTLKSARASVSLSDLIGGKAKRASEQAAAEATTKVANIDPESERKLREAKPRFVESLMERRRRFGVIFETMTIEANKISVTVPSQDLGDEIMRSQREWTAEIAEFAGVEGYIELSVVVNERVKAARPITLEDRLRHLSSKNDHLREMIERLQLDAE